jgi:hypothetical protein
MSFGIYTVGYLILIAGVAYLAHLMHIPTQYIVAVVVIMLGIGVVTGVPSTRPQDPSWRSCDRVWPKYHRGQKDFLIALRENMASQS